MLPERRFTWAADTAAPLPESGSHTASRRQSVQHSCRVLVVDDDVLIRAQLCALLHGSGYEVETAPTGDAALRLMRSYPCDIVVTDWQMPKMDGVALCREIRSTDHQDYVYVVMLTVKASPKELLAGFSAGADDYVVKGTSPDELLARLEKGRRIAHWRASHRSTDEDAGDLSLIDTATGAYNHAYLMQHLPRELARSERHGHSLSVLSCKMDSTGQIHSQYRTAAWDEAIRGFVACTTASIRSADWLVRTADHEFLVVLPETDAKGAHCVARKLLDAFSRHEFAVANNIGDSLDITVTATSPQHKADGAAMIRSLLRRAQNQRSPTVTASRDRAESGTVHYLNDFVLNADTDIGRNWPVT